MTTTTYCISSFDPIEGGKTFTLEPVINEPNKFRYKELQLCPQFDKRLTYMHIVEYDIIINFDTHSYERIILKYF